MIYRQKVLLALIQELEEILNEENFQLLLFLFCNEFVDNNHYYDFIPTKNEPISLQAEEDRKHLKKGVVKPYIQKLLILQKS